MAELDEAEKNRISHRGRAFDKLRLVLEKVLAERDAITREVAADARLESYLPKTSKWTPTPRLSIT